MPFCVGFLMVVKGQDSGRRNIRKDKKYRKKRGEMLADKYKRLMKDFINEVITVEEFEREYLITFKEETERMGSPLFEILNGVFEAVDCYWHECLPGQETAFEISEQRLRKEVNEALILLNRTSYNQ